MGLLFTFVQTCLAYFSHGDECLLHSWRLLLGSCAILLNTCLITYDHLQMLWTSLKTLLTALAYADMILLLLFTWQVEQNWLPIWHVFRLTFEMFQVKFQTCKELHRQWFSCFQEKVPSLNSDFHLFYPSMKHMTSSPISELGNSTQNFDLLSKRYFQHIIGFHSICFNFKQEMTGEIYLLPMVVHASSSEWHHLEFNQKLFNHTMHFKHLTPPACSTQQTSTPIIPPFCDKIMFLHPQS
jgi:hypothetical protein